MVFFALVYFSFPFPYFFPFSSFVGLWDMSPSVLHPPYATAQICFRLVKVILNREKKYNYNFTRFVLICFVKGIGLKPTWLGRGTRRTRLHNWRLLTIWHYLPPDSPDTTTWMPWQKFAWTILDSYTPNRSIIIILIAYILLIYICCFPYYWFLN